jgi:16S rRNA processing protein RimM
MGLWALQSDGSRRQLQVEDLWPHKGHVVFKFVGIDSISDAEALEGCELQVPRQDRAALDTGWAYISDLAGCTVFDGGRELGKIRDVRFGAGEAPLLVVESGSQEYEIPYAEAFLQSVNVQAKEIRMQLPEGLLEVNAPLTPEEKEQQKQSRKKLSS